MDTEKDFQVMLTPTRLLKDKEAIPFIPLETKIEKLKVELYRMLLEKDFDKYTSSEVNIISALSEDRAIQTALEKAKLREGLKRCEQR